MTFTEFITTLRQADAQATKGLLPCPFCGKSGSVLSIERNDEHEDEDLDPEEVRYHVICDFNDGGCGASAGLTAESREEAIAGWNRRASRNTLAQTIAIMEVARKAIEDAPHSDWCAVHKYPTGSGLDICTCWKSRALSSIDALAAKTP